MLRARADEPEAAHLSRLYGQEQALGYEAVLLDANEEGGEVVARALWPDTALVEYLHRHGMRRLSRRLVSSGALDVVATAVPGMPDVLLLGKVKQMERAAAVGEPDAADSDRPGRAGGGSRYPVPAEPPRGG